MDANTCLPQHSVSSSWLPSLQNKKGNQARRGTEQSFEDDLAAFWAVIEDTVADWPDIFPRGTKDIIFVFDHASSQDNAIEGHAVDAQNQRGPQPH